MTSPDSFVTPPNTNLLLNPPQIPITIIELGDGETVPIAEILAYLQLMGIVENATDPKKFSATMEAFNTQANLTVPVMRGGPGNPGKNGPTTRFQNFYITDINDLPTDLLDIKSDLGKFWLFPIVDHQTGKTIATTIYIWFGLDQGWQEINVGEPGSPGPYPNLFGARMVPQVAGNGLGPGNSDNWVDVHPEDPLSPELVFNLVPPQGIDGPAAPLGSMYDVDCQTNPAMPGSRLVVSTRTTPGAPTGFSVAATTTGISPSFDTIGAGQLSFTGGLTWREDIGLNVTAGLIYVNCVSLETNLTFSATVNGQPMAPLQIQQYQSGYYIVVFGLAGMPVGPGIEFNVTSSSAIFTYMVGNSICFANVSGFGTVGYHAGSGTTATQTIASKTGRVVVQGFANAATNGSFSSFSGTLKYNQPYHPGQNYPLIFGTSPGALSVTTTAPQSNSAYGGVAVELIGFEPQQLPFVSSTKWWQVTATMPNGESLPCAASSQVFTTAAAALLNWTAPAGAGATGYKVYRGATAGTVNQLVAVITSGTTTSFLDDNLTGSLSAVPPITGMPVGAKVWVPQSIAVSSTFIYTVPESAFTSTIGIQFAGTQPTVGTFSFPVHPWPWVPFVFGQIQLSGLSFSLTPLLVGATVMLGSPDPAVGQRVAHGFSNGEGVVTLIPGMGNYFTPQGTTSIVPANHTGTQGTVYVTLQTANGFVGLYDFNSKDAQLSVLVVPIIAGT